jgi:ATP/maltotriose-dependent transcriptional regulator MalT
VRRSVRSAPANPRRGQPERALEQVESAIELNDGRASEGSQFITITHGEILAALGDRSGAAAQYQAALDGSRRLSLFYYETNALVHLAGVQLESGAGPAARTNAQHALDIATEHEFRALECKARKLLAKMSDPTAGGRPRRHSTSGSSI